MRAMDGTVTAEIRECDDVYCMLDAPHAPHGSYRSRVARADCPVHYRPGPCPEVCLMHLEHEPCPTCRSYIAAGL